MHSPVGAPSAGSSMRDASSSTTTRSNERSARSRLAARTIFFVGSDGGAARWATVASLLATAKLNGVEPFAYLKEVLERLSNDHPMTRLDDLLPWNWTRSSDAA